MSDKAIQPTASRQDPWQALSSLTPARIALGRSGGSLPSREVLRFTLALAEARDAVHAEADWAAIAKALSSHGFASVPVCSQAGDRRIYLQRPDLGRRLSADSLQTLQRLPQAELVFVIADGLSAQAVERHAVPLLCEARPLWQDAGWRSGPVVLASQARVALGDEVGQALGARMVVLLVGERPGLSSPDSLGIYLTYAPQVGRLDAERNCLSNVRPEGLPVGLAARKLAWMLTRARELALTGVGLKDESDVLVVRADGG
ncbi:ethanolamine ammonia-lyase subunit EutC [Paludibacterium sp. THUN1379]|uniref:ethanolamine ammonia-lyase subunit EutC n=1 Tax=Paludibacterium sp. THUN1379 TaxID=3112107 RepID=UPI00308965C7|nr:ethanolamine ammonia-lyase subunit EutC [Paludibacterium sp. THUN1379]